MLPGTEMEAGHTTETISGVVERLDPTTPKTANGPLT